MAFRYAEHHPGYDYRIAASIVVGVNNAYPTITVTALDMATYIQNRDRSIPWNFAVRRVSTWKLGSIILVWVLTRWQRARSSSRAYPMD